MFKHVLNFFQVNSNQNYSEKYAGWKLNLIFICLAQFFAMIAMSSVVPFMPLYLKELGIDSPSSANFWSGLIFAGPYFLSIIVTPLWGSLGDKYGRKLMIVRAVFGLFLAVFLMGFSQNIYHLLFLRIFQGAVSGMIAAALAFVAADAPSEKAGYSIGILQSSISAGNIIGPFAGGIISDLAGIRNVFIIVSLLLLLAGVLVTIYVKEPKIRSTEKIDSSIMENFKFVIKNKSVLFIIILIIISQAGINFTSPIFFFYVENLNAPKYLLSTITGSLLAVVGIMSIIFAPFWGKKVDNEGYKKIVTISTFILSISLFSHVIIHNYLLLYPVRAIAGIFFAAVLPSLYTALNRNAPLNNKGGIMGMASSANLLGTLAAYLLCGYFTSYFGINSAFIIAGTLLLSVPLLILYNTKIRRRAAIM